MVNESKKLVPKQCWFAPCDSKLFRFWVDEIYEPKVFLYSIEVICLSWRLRTHKTKTIALLGEQDEIVRRLPSIQYSDKATW